MVQSGLGSSLGSSGEEVMSHPVTLKMLFYVKIVIKPFNIEAQAQNKGQKNQPDAFGHAFLTFSLCR